ncbi:MAG: metallophosphoesterase [Candidatus Saccharibacteria bacterium]|nr:metallophosphoesterase [Moraxellaceae bacterium]
MLTRISIAIGFLALLNLYAASRIIMRWAWAGEHLLFTCFMFFGFFALQLLAPFGDRLIFPDLKKNYDAETLVFVLDWLSYLAFGILSFLVVYVLATDIISFIWKRIAAPVLPVDFDRRALLTLGFLTIGTTIIGIRQAVVGPSVRKVEIPLNNLPVEFEGFKIVQISDLHLGPTIGYDYTQNVVNIANHLKPDLVALTGDFVDGTVEDLIGDLAPITQLRATHGSFFVTGNHEYYWNASAWMEAFRTLGADVLANEHRLIKHNGAEIVLAGVTDYSMTGKGGSIHSSDPAKAIEGAPPSLVKILLAHQPASYQSAHEAGFDLQLSGHTHAGQYFPFNVFIRFFHRFYRGLNRYEKMWIYVNSGTGYWGPPLRTGVPSEITLITLRSVSNLKN